jgi:hypothetical protein
VGERERMLIGVCACHAESLTGASVRHIIKYAYNEEWMARN